MPVFQGLPDYVVIIRATTADPDGNLNVSKFGPRFAGAGGFTNISQSAKKVVFVGTFNASGVDVGVENGTLVIRREDSGHKFVNRFEHVTYNGSLPLAQRPDADLRDRQDLRADLCL